MRVPECKIVGDHLPRHAPHAYIRCISGIQICESELLYTRVEKWHYAVDLGDGQPSPVLSALLQNGCAKVDRKTQTPKVNPL
jgi:hypothetical protein